METLRQGSRGSLVDLAQTLLNDAFYASGTGSAIEQDGVFGPQTAARLREFMAEATLMTVHAVLDDRAWRALGVRMWVEHPTQMVSQHTDMLCWNAAAAMTLGVVQSMTSGGAQLGADTGLAISDANVAQFLRAVGLQPASPPADGNALAEIVSSRRIWLAGQVSGGVGGATHHAVCISGVVKARAPRAGAGSDRVLCRMHDPWPPSASGGAQGGTIRWQHYYIPRMYFGGMLFAPLHAGI